MQRRRMMVRSRRLAWLDVLVAVCSAGGLTASTLYSVQFRTSDYAGSDFKTLYASVWCFAHRIDAYSIAKLQQVFIANGVVQPEKWYGHAPVYPWTTLAVLSPLAAIGMVPAIYVLTILSGLLMAAAMMGLMRYAATNFDLGPMSRLAIAPLCAISPLYAFGMAMGNVSLAVSALCFMAFVLRGYGPAWSRGLSPWIAGAGLALAFLLKPHLALWVGVGMFLLPERAARTVVLRAAALAAGFATVTAAVMAAMGTLRFQTQSYLAMLSAEASKGASMNATSHEPIPVVAQITSLESILGFWIANSAVRIGLTCVGLLGLGFLVVRQTRRVDSERGALLAVVSWSTLGMLATYHRAHDAVLLLLAVPWVVDRIRRTPWAWPAWAIAVFYCAMSLSADFPYIRDLVTALPTHSFTAFLLLRQAGLATSLLLLTLLIAMKQEHAQVGILPSEETETEDLHAAA